MNDDNVAKSVFVRNSEGRSRRGRPKLRWKDSVLEDYQKLGVEPNFLTYFVLW